MKKVKASINEGSEGRMFYVFGSPESAYVWLTEAHDDPSVIDKIEDVENVAVLPGEFIEAEWCGCEYAYSGQSHVKVDFVRFAKVSKPKNASGLVVSIHFGWTADCIIPFRDYIDDDIVVKVLSPDDDQLDLTILFKDEESKKDNQKPKR